MPPATSSEVIDGGLVASLRGLDRNGRALFAMRTLRMFGYGFLAVTLVLYLDALGLDAPTIGLVLTLTLVGDTLLSLWLTTHADRIGRRHVLVGGAILMVIAGAVFALTDWVPLLILAATIGVISPTGNEVGPFLAVEQAALAQTVPDARRTATFACTTWSAISRRPAEPSRPVCSASSCWTGACPRSTPTARSSSGMPRSV